jgi:hypothetical protein
MSQAVWLTLKSMPRNILEDRSEAERVVHTVARIASREINIGKFEVSRYNDSVREKSIAALQKKTVSPLATQYPALNWRRAASGRLDAFTDHGSYHITDSAEGYEARWLYQSQSSFLGTFRSEAQAKQAAEKHAASHNVPQANPRRRRR